MPFYDFLSPCRGSSQVRGSRGTETSLRALPRLRSQQSCVCRKCVLKKSSVWVQYISDVTPGDFAHHMYTRHSLPATAALSVSWGHKFLEQLPALSLSICVQNTMRVAKRRKEAVDESHLFCFANNQVPSFELCYAALTDWLGGRWLLGECCRAEVIFFQTLSFCPLATKKSS